jgi:hypothetical protein
MQRDSLINDRLSVRGMQRSKSSQRTVSPVKPQTRPCDIVNTVATGELHATSELVVECVKHQLHALLAVVLQSCQ